jgi:plastocyanin
MKRILFSHSMLWMLVIGVVATFPQMSKAQTTWNLYVGAENKDEGRQADALLPNEAWIWKNDKIQWNWQPINEVHTVTLQKTNGLRPPPGGGAAPFNCPFASAPPVVYDDTACVSSAIQSVSSTAPPYHSFTVQFTTPGDYPFFCEIHTNMRGTVHVLQSADNTKPFYAASLPYIQSDYDNQAKDEAQDIIGDTDSPTEEVKDFPRAKNEVLMTGEMVATGGGRQYLAIVRFFPETIYIQKGETVEFTNVDPTEPHTVTSGTTDTLTNDMGLVNASTDSDGAALASTVNMASAFGNATQTTGVSSGFLQASPEDAVGRAVAAPGTTRIRITFNVAGTFYYHCALHDVDGMQGKVVVKP